MTQKEWAKRKKQWDEFNAWQAGQSYIQADEALRLVGELVDFYFERNKGLPAQLPAGYGEGVMEMHRLLSCWKMKG